jgi:acyl-CoA thioester hydrolase
VVNAYLIERCGLKPTDTASKDPIGLVVSSGCNYFSSLSFPQVVDLGLRVSKLGNSSVTYEVGFFAQGSDAVAAVGGFTHVFVDPKSRRPTAMVENMRAGLKELYSEDMSAKL